MSIYGELRSKNTLIEFDVCDDELCECPTDILTPVEVYDIQTNGYGVRALLDIHKGFIVGKYAGKVVLKGF